MGTTPWRLMHGEKRTFPDFVHSDAGYALQGFISTQKEEIRASIHSELLR
jgi:hypothetical protein